MGSIQACTHGCITQPPNIISHADLLLLNTDNRCQATEKAQGRSKPCYSSNDTSVYTSFRKTAVM